MTVKHYPDTKISVVIPYRNRQDNLEVLLSNLKNVSTTYVDFHLISLGDANTLLSKKCEDAGVNFHYQDYQGLFSIGKAINTGAKLVKGEYILKQDVDCLPYPGLYEKLVEHTISIDDNKFAWANIGVYYCNSYFSQKYLHGPVTYETYLNAKYNDSYKEKLKIACGNCFLVNREHYLEIGGISDRFHGWGWEDYQLLYYLEKAFNPAFKLSSYNERSVVKNCREELARPKNAFTNELDLIFLHRWHDKAKDEKNYRKYTQSNRELLLELVSKFKPFCDSDVNCP